MFFQFSDINKAFNSLVTSFHNGLIPTKETDSRNGKVLQAVHPVTVCFTNPKNRVLFHPGRDCNPFFHMYESFWMLAGKSDVESVEHFASKMGSYSDDGYDFWGAYGRRWRSWFGYDQLWKVIQQLDKDPGSRRAVLQMWDGYKDLKAVEKGSKDVPCNLCCIFSVNEDESGNFLDMTVMNRSNDLVWGLCGANVVHMSFLLEYVASYLCNVKIGRQYHITNNLHIYTETNSGFKPELWGTDTTYNLNFYSNSVGPHPGLNDCYCLNENAVTRVAQNVDGYFSDTGCDYIDTVVRPMLQAFTAHKERRYDKALKLCERIKSHDWMVASRNWIERRQLKWQERNHISPIVGE